MGNTVTNPVTGLTTTVNALLVDPTGTPTAGTTAFVRTADGYAFLVKAVGQIIYNSDTPPLGFTIVSSNPAANTVQLDAAPPGGPTATLSTRLLYTTLQAELFGSGTPGTVTPPVVVSGASGVRVVSIGDGGSNGRDGALFVPPESGGRGQDGPAVDYTNTTVVRRRIRSASRVGSVGGRGGNGGNRTCRSGAGAMAAMAAPAAPSTPPTPRGSRSPPLAPTPTACSPTAAAAQPAMAVPGLRPPAAARADTRATAAR